MWERLDSRLSPYRTPGANGFSVELFFKPFSIPLFFTLTFIEVGDIFLLTDHYILPLPWPTSEGTNFFCEGGYIFAIS